MPLVWKLIGGDWAIRSNTRGCVLFGFLEMCQQTFSWHPAVLVLSAASCFIFLGISCHISWGNFSQYFPFATFYFDFLWQRRRKNCSKRDFFFFFPEKGNNRHIWFIMVLFRRRKSEGGGGEVLFVLLFPLASPVTRRLSPCHLNLPGPLGLYVCCNCCGCSAAALFNSRLGQPLASATGQDLEPFFLCIFVEEKPRACIFQHSPKA